MLDHSRRGTRPRRLAAAAIVAVLSIAFAFGAPARAQTTTPVYVGTSLDAMNALVFYAQDLGYFKKAGLDVEVHIMANGAAIAAAILGGTVQIGAGNVVAIANAHERGLPLKFIAGSGVYTSANPTTLMVVASNSAIRSAKDLNGKIVAGLSVGGLDQVSALAFIDQNGGDSKSIKYVELPSSEMAAALERGTINAAVLSEPALGAARGKVRSIGSPYDFVAKELMDGAYFARTDWLTQNPAVAKSFAQVMAQSAQWANDNPEKAAVIRSKYTKLTIDPARPLVIKYSEALDPAMFQPIIDAAAKYKAIPHSFPAGEILWTQ